MTQMELKYGVGKGVISVAAIGLLLACTSILMFVTDPLESCIKLILNLSEGTIFYNLWSAPPYDVILKLYAFNLTNPEEFLAGKEKMNLTELGPYVYKEILTNNDAIFDEERGTVTYRPFRDIIYDEVRSKGDPKVDNMFTTNLPLVGLQAYLSDSSFITNIGFSTFARTMGAKSLMNISVHEYLWGYQDSLIKYANKFIPSWIDFEKFGIFERLLSRDNTNLITIVKNPAKYHSKYSDYLTEEERNSQYHVVEWNDSPGLLDWGFEEIEKTGKEVKKCHLVEGAFDGTIFPRDLRVNRSITLFRKAFCRPVSLKFIGEAEMRGFNTYRYSFPNDMFDATPENDCFCYKGRCFKGLQSIAPCYYGIPLTLSQPHYLNADPMFLEQVNGLKPVEELHDSNCYIQPQLGVPVGGTLRIQINLDVGKTKYNSQTKIFNGLNIPLFWLEITTADLPSMVQILLTLGAKVLPVVLETIKYLLLLGGLAMISGSSAFILLKNRTRIPYGVSRNHGYHSLPLITLPNEVLSKLERRISLKV